MKVLIVAYACEPGKGSEPGIGWDWVTALARHANLEVIVLTRANNRSSIEQGLAELPADEIPRFVYFELPKLLVRWKRAHVAIYPYYLLWCLASRRIIRRLVLRENIDVVHHLTFSTDWLPGCIPVDTKCATVLGPLGGYDTVLEMAGFISKRSQRLDSLKKFFRYAGLRARRWELERATAIIANNESFARTYSAHAPGAWVTSLSTQLCTAEPPKRGRTNRSRPTHASARKLLLSAGRLVYWKGYDVVLETLAVLLRRGVQFEGLIVGSGDTEYVTQLRNRAHELGLSSCVKFCDQMDRGEFLELTAQIDVFIYPTFYSTADSIMMEVVEHGIPIVCFPTNGARELLGDDYLYFAAKYTAESLADQVELADKHAPENITAVRRISEAHSAEHKLSRVINLYQESVDRYRLENPLISRGGGDR